MCRTVPLPQLHVLGHLKKICISYLIGTLEAITGITFEGSRVMSLFWKGQSLTNAHLTADYVIHTTTSIVHSTAVC